MITIYHNNRCGKSRSALSILADSGKPYKVVDYLKEVPTTEELQSIIRKLKIHPHDLIRMKEAVYIEKFKGKELTDEQWIQAMHDFPILIERPVVLNGNKAVIARPPEKVRTIL
jgi:arsenate reductase (glutaredoxin)